MRDCPISSFIPSLCRRGGTGELFQIEDVLPVLGVTLGQDGHAAYDVATGLFPPGPPGRTKTPLWR